MFHKFPYTDFHELNIDWVLTMIKDFIQKIKDFNDHITTVEGAIEALRKYVDDYFGNLDIYQELSNIIDQLVSDGTLEGLIEKYTSVSWYEHGDFTYYAQDTGYLVDNHGNLQGGCIGVKDGVPYMLCCNHSETTRPDIGILSVYNMETGARVYRANAMQTGHSNSCCYYNGSWYVVSNTNKNVYKVAFDLSGIDETITIPDAGNNIYGISYADGRFYILTEGPVLLVCNTDFEILRKTPFSHITTTAVGVMPNNFKIYEGKMYIVYWQRQTTAFRSVGNAMVGVYDLEGAPIRIIILPGVGNEPEFIDFYHNECYLGYALADNHNAILRGSLWDNGRHYFSEVESNMVVTYHGNNYNVMEVNIDYNNSSFYCLGNTEYPFAGMSQAYLLLDRLYYDQFTVNLWNSYPKAINFNSPGVYTVIRGYHGEDIQVTTGDITIRNSIGADLRYLTPGNVTLIRTDQAVLDHVIFDNKHNLTTQVDIYVQTNYCTFADCTVNGDESCTLRLSNPTIASNAVFTWLGAIHVPFNNFPSGGIPGDGRMRLSATGFNQTQTINVNNLLVTGEYYIGANVTANNRPAGTSGEGMLETTCFGSGRGWIRQLWFTKTGSQYSRWWDGESWSAWA